ncbi:hypothetical protein FLG15_12945 [Xanthomonas phaseoli pv. dieffenbachiae]|nr:hypothetical protein IB69_011980 [Xanthomonas citri]
MARNGKRLQQDQHRPRAPQILRQHAAWFARPASWRTQGRRAPNRQRSTRRGDVQISAPVSDRRHKTPCSNARTMGHDHSRE